MFNCLRPPLVPDYLRYRQELGEAAMKHGCDLHAYVLMTNHVHLLVTPHEHGATSRMMQAVGRRYVGAFNARYRRTGTLWEGRFKSALVDSLTYLLTCYRYIELNPVRAGMVALPGAHRWSSHQHNAHGAHEPRITPHPAYLSLDIDDTSRQQSYRELFATELDSGTVDTLRAYTQQQKAWGSERFQRQIELLTERAAGLAPRGRPKKAVWKMYLTPFLYSNRKRGAASGSSDRSNYLLNVLRVWRRADGRS